MNKINWGIIGCGDVTENKSGPAFNKVPDSSLIAVMRRDGEKAKDYARRHGVPKWYDNAQQLINDPDINAIYIATPPSSHEEYAIAAINAGKPVYVEKPMTTDYASAQRIAAAAKEKNIKLTIAHYRRQQPFFKHVKQLLSEKAIGDIRLARLELYKPPLTPQQLSSTGNLWRTNPAIAGGGLFHDLAPHQIDLMYYFFGDVEKVNGIATQQGKQYAADDMVAGNILFKNGIAFSGAWCFNAPHQADYCEIIGSKGKLGFNVFNNVVIWLTVDNTETSIRFDPLKHVQQPMIERTVQYFLDRAENPCSAEEGVEVMRLMGAMVAG